MRSRKRKLRQFWGKINISEQTRTLNAVRQWGQLYLECSEIIAMETGVETLEQFLKALSNFIESIERRWMGKRLARLKKENQKLLRELLQALVRMQRDIVYHIREVERDKVLFEEMESLAFPEPTGLVRDYSGWLRSPFYYSQDLLDAVMELPVP